MFARLVSVAAAFALSAAALAQTAPADPAEQRIRAYVAFLADDLLEGREAGTRGHEIAARYVGQQLAALGFQGAGAEGSFFQPVGFQRRRLAPGEGRLTLDLPGASQTFTHGTEILMAPSLDQPSDTIEAPLAFAGYGLTAPALGHDDYAGLDVRGRIVVVFAGTPAGWAGDVAAHLGGEKLRMAQEAGAIGVITVRRPTDERVRAWERVIAGAGRSRVTWLTPEGRPFVEAPGIRVSMTAGPEAARALLAGAAQEFEALQALAEAGQPMRGFALPGRATIRRNSSFERFASPNVVGILPGSDPALRDEVVVLMAHLDHLGLAAEGDDRVYNGAMDNASGIAIMLEAARALAEGRRPRRSVMVLATTAEESGLLGAEYFAAHPPMPRERIVAAVNMDMPILTYDLAEAVGFGAEHSTLGPVAEAAMRAEGVRLVPDPTPEQRSFTRSDHYPLVRAGIPSIYIDSAASTEESRAAIEAFDAHYHEVSDDLSQPFHWPSAARLARINAAIARAIATARERPRWRQGSFFADTFAPGQPRAR